METKEIKYGEYTVRELIEALEVLALFSVDGDETMITLGDTEGNRTWRLMQPILDEDENTIKLNFEFHEEGSDNVEKIIKEMNEPKEQEALKDIVDKYGFSIQFNSTEDYDQIEGLTKVAKFFIDKEKKIEEK